MRAPNSTPIVRSCCYLKRLSVNCKRRHDFPTPKNIIESACKALKDGHHGYTSANGLLELRECVSNDFKNRNLPVSKQEVQQNS